MEVRIDSSWKEILGAEFDKEYFVRLTEFVRAEYGTRTVYPPASKIFAAFDSCPFDKVKVVILGQDPYHGEGQANGLCFSVNPGIAPPPLARQYIQRGGCRHRHTPSTDGDLSRWARQGVLMLNATLTVGAHSPGSHQGHGWEEFTDAVVRNLAENARGWCSSSGALTPYAKEPSSIATDIWCSPLPTLAAGAARGFFGNHHFTRTNQWLQSHGLTPIAW